MKIHLATALFLAGLTISHAASYDAELSGLNEVPPNPSPGYGSADFSLSGSTLTVTEGTYSDLLGNSSVVALYDGAAGANGPVIGLLALTSPGTTSGTFSGSDVLTSGQLSDLVAGELYVNLRTTVYPSGEIRGQLLSTSVPDEASCAGLLGGTAAILLAWKKRRA